MSAEIRQHGGASYNHRCCGLHIHADKYGLNTFTQANLIIFFLRCQGAVEKVAQRKANDFCRFNTMGTAHNVSEGVKIYYKVKNDPQELRRSRYVAVNFCNRKTIEFRVFKGTLAVSTILASIAFIDSVIDYCRSVPCSTLVKIDGAALWGKYCEHLETRKDKAGEILRKYIERKKLYTFRKPTRTVKACA